ncbi:RDD family protein [Dyella sp. A6]|uniref:RDD family protein n=1 Tax=Dyella aluminiiresistens TaxID=3069105 RepID=UPI002E763696|nr:RDD family protein [Dyella sp. A6]
MEVWIGRNGERHGPYKEDEVRQWLRSGQVSSDDLGWYDGLADWQPLSVLFPGERPTESSSSQSVGAAPAPAALPRGGTAILEDHAGFWRRFGAWVIDYLILLVPTAVIASSMGASAAFEHLMTQIHGGTDPAAAAMVYSKAVRPATMIALVIGFLYYAICESSAWQATPGKLAVGMRVTDLDGRRISLGRSLGRNAIRLVNIVTFLLPLICYLTVAWNARKQGLHDMMARTLVLNGRASDFKDNAQASGNTGDGSSFNA